MSRQSQQRTRRKTMSRSRPTAPKAPMAKKLASAAVAVQPGIQATRLARALQALSHGLPNPWDESDDFFHEFAAVMPASTALDPESFRSALRIGARYHIDLSPADDVLAELSDPDLGWGEEIAGGFKQLATVMHATLTDVSRAFARGTGVVRVRVWLFGRTVDGTLVGLHSISTET